MQAYSLMFLKIIENTLEGDAFGSRPETRGHQQLHGGVHNQAADLLGRTSRSSGNGGFLPRVDFAPHFASSHLSTLVLEAFSHRSPTPRVADPAFRPEPGPLLDHGLFEFIHQKDRAPD